MAPVFPVVVEAFPEHGHDFAVGDLVLGEVWDFLEDGGGGAPVVVGGGFADFDFGFGVVVDYVFDGS